MGKGKKFVSDEKSKKVWRLVGEGKMIQMAAASEREYLEDKVYIVKMSDQIGLYVEEVSEKFELPEKIYDIENSFVERVVKTWNAVDENLGILLNGLKGTGKTVTAKMICNRVGCPVILVTAPFDGVPELIGSIWQDCVVLIDEYEKIYKDHGSMLTVMDGVFTGRHKKMFILTTNDTKVSEFMISRPGRIRYLKYFNDLRIDTIKEIVDDTISAEAEHLKAATIKFISRLQLLTVDIVRAVVQEVNIHVQDPEEFASVFNVKKGDDEFNIAIVKANGAQSFKYYASVSPESIFAYEYEDEDEILKWCGNSLYINGSYQGDIYAIDKDRQLVVIYGRYGFMLMKIESTQGVHQSFRDDDFSRVGEYYKTKIEPRDITTFLDWVKNAETEDCPFGVCDADRRRARVREMEESTEPVIKETFKYTGGIEKIVEIASALSAGKSSGALRDEPIDTVESAG